MGDKKGKANQEKHGVSFAFAQLAFLDQNRIILEDLEHSKEEKRFYCLGKIWNTAKKKKGSIV